jgi:hypothetical protein
MVLLLAAGLVVLALAGPVAADTLEQAPVESPPIPLLVAAGAAGALAVWLRLRRR